MSLLLRVGILVIFTHFVPCNSSFYGCTHHNLCVGILVISLLLHTYLLANIALCFILILWHCIPLQPRVFMTLLLWVGILVISTYFIVCIHSLESSYLLLFNIYLRIVIVRLWYYFVIFTLAHYVFYVFIVRHIHSYLHSSLYIFI